jgi:hypothetical protein
MVTLRMVAVLALLSVSHAAVAKLIELEISGSVIAAAGTHWVGPGPTPRSMQGSIIIDSMAFASREVSFVERDPSVGPRLDTYRFEGVRVNSIAIKADGSELLSEPKGLTLTFSGDNPTVHGLGGYFAFAGGHNSADESLSLSYDSLPGLTEAQANDGGDVLGNVLDTEQFVPGSYQIQGAWGVIAGSLFMQVAAIPEPSAVLALLIGLMAIAFHLRCARCRGAETRAGATNQGGFQRHESPGRLMAARRLHWGPRLHGLDR